MLLPLAVVSCLSQPRFPLPSTCSIHVALFRKCSRSIIFGSGTQRRSCNWFIWAHPRNVYAPVRRCSRIMCVCMRKSCSSANVSRRLEPWDRLDDEFASVSAFPPIIADNAINARRAMFIILFQVIRYSKVYYNLGIKYFEKGNLERISYTERKKSSRSNLKL